jgi:hypothetical protein
MPTDKTKEVLEQILAQLYSEQAKKSKSVGGSYLQAQDSQFLGKITQDAFDRDSLLNQYGPYGSQYSPTSVFNPYSPYGSQYGPFSLNNPYSATPPRLYIAGRFLGFVTVNEHNRDRIATDAFLHALKTNVASLLLGNVPASPSDPRRSAGSSYIEAADGTFLGKLNPNAFDIDSIFNQFGQYGNRFSQTSIFNQFAPYGNQFSQLSPHNRFTQTPPKIFLRGQFFAYLTVNSFLSPRVEPDQLKDWAQANVPRFG